MPAPRVPVTRPTAPAKPLASSYISARHLLSEPEIRFCIAFVASGGTKAPSVRSAFPEVAWNDKRAYARAATLLNKPSVLSYIQELREAPTDSARRRLTEQVKLGADAQAGKAAERVLADEDKLGVRDAAFVWAEVLCEAGAEVAIALPDACPSCGARITVSTPLARMFPKTASAQGSAEEPA